MDTLCNMKIGRMGLVLFHPKRASLIKVVSTLNVYLGRLPLSNRF